MTGLSLKNVQSGCHVMHCSKACPIFRKSVTLKTPKVLRTMPSNMLLMTPVEYYIYQKKKYLQKYDEAMEMA